MRMPDWTSAKDQQGCFVSRRPEQEIEQDRWLRSGLIQSLTF